MKAKCPKCKNYTISLKEKLKSNKSTPVVCSCGQKSYLTPLALFIGAFVMTAIVYVFFAVCLYLIPSYWFLLVWAVLSIIVYKIFLLVIPLKLYD